jgi:RNA polymerase sigma-70 factor (ECF subfamily)
MDLDREIELIGLCRNGDAQAFAEIYDAYVKPIHDFIFYKVHHRQTAEDLTSETFFRAVSHLDRLDPAKGRISSWLYRIARNAVTDHYRTRRPQVSADDAWDLAADDRPDVDADISLRLDAVREHLKLLKPEQRDIVIMRVWQQMSYAEIAGALGKSEASCKMMFSRSIKFLRKNMPLAALIIFLTGKML